MTIDHNYVELRPELLQPEGEPLIGKLLHQAPPHFRFDF